MTMTLTKADVLAQCGEALYGRRWHTPLSHDLEVSDRTLRRWVNGTMDIPDGVWTDLRILVRERRVVLDKLMQLL